METTKKLYDMDNYATEFDAVVLSCEEIACKEKKENQTLYEVVLDQTVFFPEEGGQSCDQGILDGSSVVDVQIKKGIIYHTVEKALAIGATVHGSIDWKHRFNNMQQHSGEHIFSGLVNRTFGFDNVGFHLSNQIVTMDFNGVLTLEQAEEIERKANEAICSNVPILISYPTKEELATLSYRSKIEIEGQVRIVTIPGTDVCACCAPHVKYTGEIGMLKIMSMQNYKGGVRFSILCGYRALEDYQKKNSLLTDLCQMFSTNIEALPAIIEKLKNTNQELKYELLEVKKRHLQEMIDSIPVEQNSVIIFEDGIDAVIMRNAVNELVKQHSGYCAVFTGNDSEGYQFILGSNSLDSREMMAKLKEGLNARGGGSTAMVQGSVNAKMEDIQAVFER